MKTIRIHKGSYPPLFGGLGFHNNEACLYPLIEKEHFNQVLCKCYREISPGFMRTFAGYDNWTQKAMDAFAEYYEQMQKVTDTPMYLTAAQGKLHFSDEEITEYGNRVAEKLEYLIKTKGVNHVRYYCFSNEMSRRQWGALLNDLPTFKKYHAALYRAFQNHDLDIGLLATDASEYESWNTMDWAIENMSELTEDYCLHIYERAHDIDDLEFYDFFYDKCYEVVQKAIRDFGKRVILGEIGIQKTSNQLTFGKGIVIDVNQYHVDHDECAKSALMLTEMVFSAINAGIFSLAFWSYTDYPDPYSCAYSEREGYAKTWGEVEKFVSWTTDSKYNKWGLFRWEDDGDHSAKPHYYCLAPLVKLFKRNSKVLEIQTDDPMLRCCAILNKDNSVSFGVVNRHRKPVEIALDTDLFNKPVRVIEYDSHAVPENKFADIQDFACQLEPDAVTYTLKPESVTFFTTDYVEKTSSVFANVLGVEDGVLRWETVDDPTHCYYRVYASSTPDFVPCAENQIASTVATNLPQREDHLFYKVLSVDVSGNV